MTGKRFKYTFEGIEDTLESDEEYKYTLCNKDGFQDLCVMLNKLYDENEQLKKELKRCKDWINSDKNDYELTLSFIKNKGYSLKDVLEYEKELKKLSKNKKQKEFVDFGNSQYCLVDGTIYVTVSKIFEMIERYDDLEEFESFLGLDLDYIVATYLEKK